MKAKNNPVKFWTQQTRPPPNKKDMKIEGKTKHQGQVKVEILSLWDMNGFKCLSWKERLRLTRKTSLKTSNTERRRIASTSQVNETYIITALAFCGNIKIHMQPLNGDWQDTKKTINKKRETYQTSEWRFSDLSYEWIRFLSWNKYVSG